MPKLKITSIFRTRPATAGAPGAAPPSTLSAGHPSAAPPAGWTPSSPRHPPGQACRRAKVADGPPTTDDRPPLSVVGGPSSVVGGLQLYELRGLHTGDGADLGHQLLADRVVDHQHHQG